MIPVCEPLLGEAEKKLLGQCLDEGWVSSEGPYVGQFERIFASYIGVKEGVAVMNGTAALEAALYGLDLPPGSEVLMPSFTIISCAAAAIRLGLKPVLTDLEPDTWNMEVSQLEEKISPKSSAIMPVHIYGHPADLDRILALSRKHGLKVLEDASECHGAEVNGRKAGSLGHASAFSFYSNKIVTTGEGGMVLSDDPVIAERARSYRNLCFQPGRRFFHEELGYNFRMTSLQAALGIAQMQSIDRFIALRERIHRLYRERLAEEPRIRFQARRSYAKPVTWMVAVELTEAEGPEAKTIMDRMAGFGVGTRPFFLGLHEQPCLQRLGLFKGERYPNTERASRYGFYLPSGAGLTESQVDEAVSALRRALG